MELINQTVSFSTPMTTAAALASATPAPRSVLPVSVQTSAIGNHGPRKVESDRDVIRCMTCGMVQYRTRNGNCRRCLHLLAPKIEFLIPTPKVREPIGDRQPFEKWPNYEMVENIGQRIRQLRESRGMTQTQLQARSRVSRSYLSRIESGQMTPRSVSEISDLWRRAGRF
jgi:hypothetical protein